MSQEVSTRRIALRVGLVVILQSGLLFGTAGTFRWTEAWICTIGYFSFVIAMMAWLKKNNPELLEDRMTYLKKTARTWDKVIILGSTVAYIVLYSIPGLDAVRYHWTHMPIFFELLGFAGVLISLLLFFIVMKENPFLSRIVEIQKDRGHKVITTGPYQFVRHPMYAAGLLFLLSMPLALGSWYGLIPTFVCALFMIVRTYLEDRTLHEELEGYRDYAMRVGYRIVPGIW
jgi:protein-S-isoprenylcysteine O-methyltransferase Ste14